MRCSAIIAAGFAAGALAGPIVKKDGNVVVVDDTVYDTVTDVVATVTVPPGGGNAPSAAAQPAVQNNVQQNQGQSQGGGASTFWTTWSAPAPTQAAPAPPQQPASSQPAPPPANTQAAPPASSAAAAPSSAAPPSQSGLTDFQNNVLGHHNAHRSNHSAKALNYDTNLEGSASKVASYCNSTHITNLDGQEFGQNYYFSSQSITPGDAITDAWYAGELENYNPFYGQATPSTIGSDLDAYGHFTQIVWQSAQTVGCAQNFCSQYVNEDSKSPTPYFFVCNYQSQDGTNGNMIGSFAQNVAKPLGQPGISASQNF